MPFRAHHAMLALGLMLGAPLAAAPQAEQHITVRRGDTLAELLAAAGARPADAQAAIAALSPLLPPRNLMPGQEIALRLDGGGVARLEIATAPGRTVVLRREGEGFAVEQHEAERLRHLARVEATLDAGLMPGLVRAGLPPALASGLVRALAHEVDFERDIRPGDRISVAFERFRGTDGDLLGHGRALQARLTLSGREISIWRFEEPGGSSAWYDQDGHPLAGGFLRTPLDGARLTSGFGPRRHPVHGFGHLHRGVDFAAPPGTPVQAAADGIVASLRVERGYGRIVRLHHPGGVETRYAHLARFAPGLVPGLRVRQGDLIGTVGSSGVATGPHLHYEVVVAGRAVDPARAALPQTGRLQGEALAAFAAQRRSLERKIALLAEGRTEVAMAE